MKKFRFILLLILAAALILPSIIYKQFKKNANRSPFAINNEHLQQNISIEYKELFKDSVLSNSEYFVSCLSKNTNPVSMFDYKRKYKILTHKLNCKIYETQLSSVIKESKGNSDMTSGIFYRECGFSGFDFHYQEKTIEIIQQVFLIFSTRIPKRNILENGNLISYYLTQGSFSIQFKKDSAKNVSFNEKNKSFFEKSTPINLNFLQLGTDIYLIIIAPTDDSKFVSEKLISDLLNKRK